MTPSPTGRQHTLKALIRLNLLIEQRFLNPPLLHATVPRKVITRPTKMLSALPPLQLGTGPKLTWDALFKAWETLHKAKQGAESIRKQWRSILDNFAEFARERGKTDPSEIVRAQTCALGETSFCRENIMPSPSEISYLAALRRIYAVAVSEELLGSNPAASVRVENARRRSRKMRGFTQLEAATILAAASAPDLPAEALGALVDCVHRQPGARDPSRLKART